MNQFAAIGYIYHCNIYIECKLDVREYAMEISPEEDLSRVSYMIVELCKSHFTKLFALNCQYNVIVYCCEL